MEGISTFGWVTIFAVLSAVINAVGIYAVYKNKEWAQQAKAYVMCFAAGVLISVPLLLAFPEAIEKNSCAGFAALAGFLFIFFSNKAIQHKTKQKTLAFGITAVEGIAIHSFMDGIIYTVTFSSSIYVGFLTGIGLVIHEFAEGVIIFSVLLAAGIQARKAIIYALCAASLTTPLGAFLAYPFIAHLQDSVLGLLLGFVVGVLIYISASHLLPEAAGHQKKHSFVALLAGVMLAFIIVTIEMI